MSNGLDRGPVYAGRTLESGTEVDTRVAGRPAAQGTAGQSQSTSEIPPRAGCITCSGARSKTPTLSTATCAATCSRPPASTASPPCQAPPALGLAETVRRTWREGTLLLRLGTGRPHRRSPDWPQSLMIRRNRRGEAVLLPLLLHPDCSCLV